MEIEHDLTRVKQEMQDIVRKLDEVETELELATSNIPHHLLDLKTLMQSC